AVGERRPVRPRPEGLRRRLGGGHRVERPGDRAPRRPPARRAVGGGRGRGDGRLHRDCSRQERDDGGGAMRDVRNYVFTEMAYPYLPPDETFESARVTLPNELYDPVAGSDLYHSYFDIYRAADELGLDVMLNEHHSTATCLDAAVPLSAAIVARETSTARILPLGNPISNRTDPVRVAEEMAMVD